MRHPARFVLVGSGKPEEGELRPQLLDRFGLAVEVKTSTNVADRVEVVKRRDAYENDKKAFAKKWSRHDGKLRRRIVRAREALHDIKVSDDILAMAARDLYRIGDRWFARRTHFDSCSPGPGGIAGRRRGGAAAPARSRAPCARASLTPQPA